MATALDATLEEFDLNPDPRILPMLGEINLELWRCVAELSDNSIDGFLHAHRAGVAVPQPEVRIALPVAVTGNAVVRVRDNGPGMAPEVLEQAVRAGWTGNNPIDNLGLFGMGFNIATARLGGVTTVWTTRAGDTHWHGVEIDFERLRRQRNFRTPHLRREKSGRALHGTEVVVGRLKPDQLQTLARPATQTRIREHLARSYAAMIRPGGTPLQFAMYVGERRLVAKAHCIWGENRTVQLAEHGEVSAFQPIDRTLPERLYCTHCMRWLGPGEVSCTTPECNVVPRVRRVRGWVGLQRYLSETDYGIDFIRNGRKIETGNKELFDWVVEGIGEREYPIDDPRAGGRFVGEIHLDHCRVHYTKTHFERTDPAWEEMVQIVRGRGPLRPEKARAEGFGGNGSPLYLLYQAFRRSSPRQRNGVGWSRLLRVRDNAHAVEMAKRFDEGQPDYLDDSKWYEICQSADAGALREEISSPEEESLPEGFVDEDDIPTGEDAAGLGVAEPTPQPAPPAPAREAAAELTREYEAARVRWPVEAFAAARHDPDLRGRPWTLDLAHAATRTYRFLFDRTNAVFRSATFTPRDALLAELAVRTADFTRSGPEAVDFATALTHLRMGYARSDDLDPRQLTQDASRVLSDIARSVRGSVDGDVGATLFAELEVPDQQAVLLRMARRGVTDPARFTSDGGFVEFLDFASLKGFFERHPELFLDGRYWDEPYSALDFGDGASTDLARRRVVDRLANLIADTASIAELDPTDLTRAGREELVRAALSIRLLRPDREVD